MRSRKLRESVFAALDDKDGLVHAASRLCKVEFQEASSPRHRDLVPPNRAQSSSLMLQLRWHAATLGRRARVPRSRRRGRRVRRDVHVLFDAFVVVVSRDEERSGTDRHVRRLGRRRAIACARWTRRRRMTLRLSRSGRRRRCRRGRPGSTDRADQGAERVPRLDRRRVERARRGALRRVVTVLSEGRLLLLLMVVQRSRDEGRRRRWRRPVLRREAARVRVVHAVEWARGRRPAEVVRRLDSAFDGRGRQERHRRVFDVERRRQKGRQDVLANRQRRERIVLVVAEEGTVFVLERGSTRADAALRELQGTRWISERSHV